MAILKIKTDSEFYLYMNGKLIYKHWLKTDEFLVFDVMPYSKHTLVSIIEQSSKNSKHNKTQNGYTFE